MANNSEQNKLKELRCKLSKKGEEIDKVLCDFTQDSIKKYSKKIAIIN